MAPKLPLLLLPRPAKVDVPARGGGSNGPRPDRKGQGGRLEGAFARIDKTLKQLRIDPSGEPPEKVLVLEVRKPATDFRDALVKVVTEDPRFEWLLDAPLDELDEQPSPDAPWRVYLVMASHAGARELVNKFNDYRGPAKTSAPFAGKRKDAAAWFHLFDALSDIRFWGLRDRLITNRTLEHWREDLGLQPTRFRFEVELWWRGDEKRRRAAIDGFRRQIDAAGGTILGTPCVIGPIHYCGLLAEIPTASIELVVRSLGDGRDPESADLPRDVAFLGFDDVMFFRPRAQAIVDLASEAEARATPRATRARPQGPPLLALLDGMPLENHVHLAERIIVDLELTVGCQADAGELAGSVPFALLVTLEVAEGVALPIYQQVAQRIRPRARERA